MRVIVCPDSFKGSLSAVEAAAAMEAGIRSARPDAETVAIPLADGGEGTVAALMRGTGGRIVRMTATGPLGRAVDGFYGISADGRTAVIEMAAAAGLGLVPERERNPLRTTTRGVGELLRHAYAAGCRQFVLGIGGSATNDGGAGALAALGVRFLDAAGRDIADGGAALATLQRIDTRGLCFRLGDVRVRVACDVQNPLIGPQGASAVYGPQKGADPDKVRQLDAALAKYARVIEKDLGVDVSTLPGGGAAGGMGAGLVAMLGGTLESGIDMVLDVTGFDGHLQGASLAITGEGRVDGQTACGKTVSGVLRRAQRACVPVVILAGSVGEGLEPLYAMGAAAIQRVAPASVPAEESMRRAGEFVEQAAAEVMRRF